MSSSSSTRYDKVLMKFICLECGKEFEAMCVKGRKLSYCFEDHYRPCEICGRPALVPRDKLSDKHRHITCSKKCAAILRGNTSRESLKFGSKFTRVCPECGETFITSIASQKFCNKIHYKVCPICGAVFQAQRWQLGNPNQTCSSACGTKLAHQTYHERYDADKNPEAHAAMIAKQEATMMQRYGYRNALCREGREKSGAAQAFRDKYGADYPGQVKEIMDKRAQTTFKRYGSTCSLANPEIAAKSKETLLKKYGVDNYAKSAQFLKQVITEPEKASKCKEFRDDPAAFISKYFPNSKPTLAELSEMCGIRDSSIGYILDQVGHPDIVAYTYSRMEDEIYEFLIQELGSNMIIERNTFKVITPYELDVYLPEYNFAIECDPTITHNSTTPGWSENDEPKAINYHKMKTDLCEKQGIFLFHIFGYEWSHHKDVIKSMLRNVINTTPNKIYARTTELREVSDHDAMQFLNDNHRQGGAHSSIRLGLYYEEELISLMTFSKMRNTIGTGKVNLDNCFELVRFCNKINTSVVGGASKLFKYFVDNYNPEEIRSFSDRAHTKGTLYSKLGFKYDHTSDPGYMWVDLKTDKGYARNNTQKNNIKSFLKDDAIDLSKTEVQIMKEHDFVQVFDSGVKLWIWRNKNVTNT